MNSLRGRWCWWDVVLTVLVAAVLVALWSAVAQREWISPLFLPGPRAAFDSLTDGFRNGDLLTVSRVTLDRVWRGWAVGGAAGVALGALIGAPSLLRTWLRPLFELARPAPAAAFIPVAIASIGFSSEMVLVAAGVGAAFAALLATLRGFDPPDERLVLLARVLRLSHAGFFFKFALPPAVPYMLSGLRQAFRAALMLALVGEMLASQDGLGTSILQAARSFRSPELFAGVLLLGGIALTGDVALRLVEWVLVRWRHERAVT